MYESEESKQGDYTKLYDACLEYRPVFFKWIYKNYRYSGEKAEDLFKDALICLHKWIDKKKICPDQCKPQTLLIRIAQALIISRLRKRDLAGEIDIVLCDDIDALVENEAETIFYNDKIEADIDRCLGILCEMDQQIITDFYIRNFDQRTIALIHHLPSAKAVWARIDRAMDKIRQRFGNEWKGL
jgi:RNA polymerase sigma factor (sigma-70 family)